MADLHGATLDVSRALLDREGYCRRSVSSAYYALFQCLCAVVASCMSRGDSSTSEYKRAYRVLDHRQCRDVLSKSPEFKIDLGVPFAELQDVRQWADYSIASHPDGRLAQSGQPFSLAEAYSYYRKALSAIGFVETLDLAAQIRLMVTLVVRDRS